MDMVEAVKSGDRRKILEATLLRAAQAMDETDNGAAIAALVKRIDEISAELDGMPDPNAGKSAFKANRAKRG